MKKKCSICLEERSLYFFHKDRQLKSGIRASCVMCNKKKREETRRLNLKEIRRKENLYRKSYNLKNKERVYRWHRGWVLRNKEKVKIIKKRYKVRHRLKILESNRLRRKRDILFRIKGSLRARTWSFIKSRGFHKNSNFSKYIGCTKKELLQHIESSFKDGMSWKNYGEWQLDHKIPLDSASSLEEMYKLCHYMNLQPLWRIDNQIK